ncbi:formate dehydrogenase accessory protein FdhE [Candidatus Pacearchaeota archaeon]|nr:formate dehydrogenase accessory protein FdhE [Candidatus Pacearchaeota archaeon]
MCNKCGKEWNYGGDNKHTATCPDCKASVKIINQEVDVHE